MGKAVQADLLHGMRTFRRNVPAHQMLDAWARGDYSKVTALIPWQDLPPDLEKARQQIVVTAEDAAKHSIPSLPSPVRRSLRYDTRNPALMRWLNTRAGDLIVNIQSDTQLTVQNAVRRSFDRAMTPRQVANSIRGSIGLLPRQETALANYRDGLEAEGTPLDRVDQLADAYGDRLLDNRLMTIARTETRFAANRGQLAVWGAAANQDLIDRRKARKVWIVDGDPCPICEPMDGVSAPLDGMWTLNNGDVVEIPTDAHPNCFCGMELDFGDAVEEDEDE